MFYHIFCVFLGTFLSVLLERRYLETWQTALLSGMKRSENSCICLQDVCVIVCLILITDALKFTFAFRSESASKHRISGDVHHVSEEQKFMGKWQICSLVKLRNHFGNPGFTSENKSLVLWLSRRNLSTCF